MDAGMAHGPGGRGQKWRSRNTHVNSSSASWTRAKTPQMLGWLSPYGASGAGSHGDVTHFWDDFQWNCWSSPFSLSQRELQWETRDTQLGCYFTVHPDWQGQWEIKICCHFTQLSAPVTRRNQRSGSMFPLRSTCASAHPDAQIKVQWKEWNEHELKENKPQVWSPIALLLKGRKCTGFVQHILRRFKCKR